MGPFTRLWSIMEAEREALPDDDDEVTSGHTVLHCIVNLFSVGNKNSSDT